jgi:hypothetical protein
MRLSNGTNATEVELQCDEALTGNYDTVKPFGSLWITVS